MADCIIVKNKTNESFSGKIKMKKITNLKGRSRISDTDYITKSRKFHHLTEIQRGQIEAMVKLKVPKVQIAIITLNAL